jgi:hypothetical protein
MVKEMEKLLALIEARLKQKEQIREKIESEEFKDKVFEFAVKLEDVIPEGVILKISAGEISLVYLVQDGNPYYSLEIERLGRAQHVGSGAHDIYNEFLKNLYLQELFLAIVSDSATVKFY